MAHSVKKFGIPIMLIISTLFCGCEITPPDNSNNTTMNLVFTRDNEIWTYNIPGDQFNKIIPVGSTVYADDYYGTEYKRIWADQAQWSPDGSRLLFVEAIGTDAGNMKILDLDTGNQRFFNNTIFRQDISPTWNVNGSEIVFAKSISALGQNYEIFKVDSNGQNEQQIVSRPRFLDYSPSINRSNSIIVFAGYDSLLVMQLFGVDVDGSNLRQLTNMEPVLYNMCSSPQFSPINNDVVYVATRGDSSYKDIWLAHNFDFTSPIQLTHSDFRDARPSWSNDGKYIVFTRYENQYGNHDNPTVWIITADGQEQHKLIDNGSSPDLWCAN